MLERSPDANRPEQKLSLQQRLDEVRTLMGDEEIFDPQLETIIRNLEMRIRELRVSAERAVTARNQTDAPQTGEKPIMVSPLAIAASGPAEDPEVVRQRNVMTAISLQEGIRAKTYDEACERYAKCFRNYDPSWVRNALDEYDPNSKGNARDFMNSKLQEYVRRNNKNLSEESVNVENWAEILQDKVDRMIRKSSQNMRERQKRHYIEWVNSLKWSVPVSSFESAVWVAAIRYEILAKEIIAEQRQLRPDVPFAQIIAVVLGGLAWAVVKYRPGQDKKNIDEFVTKTIHNHCRNQWN